VPIDPAFWDGRRVLLTGHTGFKGAWLALWLQQLGARVSALALPPDTEPSLYRLAEVEVEREVLSDLGEPAAIGELAAETRPSIVIHMAAQALVLRSYRDPLGTFRSNVLGTANLLDAVRRVPAVDAVLVVTSDKVYANTGEGRPFTEDDRLGGRDPYSASKACAELITASFRGSFFGGEDAPRVATARAGNVIGGGDWSPDRLVPDIIRARTRGTPIVLRYPEAVRPWQHVLEPLAGYLMMAQAMVEGAIAPPLSLNFAPACANFRSVAQLVEAFDTAFGGGSGWVASEGEHHYEAGLLTLSAERAETQLGWRPQLDFPETVGWTADWYRHFWHQGDLRRVTLDQIEAYSMRLGKRGGTTDNGRA